MVDWALRTRFVPLAAWLISAGCAAGDPNAGFTGFTSDSFATEGAESGGGTQGTGVTTFDADTGVMTGNAEEDSGPDPDTGPDPDDSGDSSDSGPTCVPEAEVCNGMDDDCDGEADNGNPGGGEDCNTGMSGVCAAGQTVCESGGIACNPVAVAEPEICDGLDNDCNGEADDGNPGGGGACNTGMLGVCAPGTNQCTGGALVCVANVAASAETCNGLDDDCDGVVDDGNPGGGGGCSTGMPGVCGPGTLSCSGGALVCQGNVGPSPEICGNGIDEDCNGVADNGCGCPFGLCETPGIPQVNGCSPCVTQVCAVDPFCCNSQWDGLCVNQVETVCAQANCVSPACAHPVCVTGTLLAAACHPCVSSICAVDPFCCNNSWDGLCVNQVGSVCGLTCP